MKIRITTDSTADLPGSITEQYGIGVAPLYVLMGGKTYRDGVDIFGADVIRHVQAGGELCTTSAPNVQDYRDLFRESLKDADAVVHISLGSGFSSSWQHACMAAEETGRVFVADSRNLSSGQGLQVLEAARMAEKGMEPEAIARQVEQARDKVRLTLVLERLDYMARGGRCSTAAALGANLMHIRPGIAVIDNGMTVIEKLRGGYDRCLKKYAETHLAGMKDPSTETVFVTHAPMDAGYGEIVKDAVTADGRFKEVLESDASCTIVCHCGPNTIGIIYREN